MSPTKRPYPLVVALAALVALFLGAAGPALAADVTINSVTTFAAADASDGSTDGVFTVTGNLTMAPGGSITCNDPPAPANASGCPITIVVHGNMEMQAGSSILAEDNIDGGSGGNISITVDGNFTMRGPDNTDPNNIIPGALISSRKLAGAGDTGHGGDIFIKVGNITVNPDDTIECATTPLGNIVMEAGSTVTADAQGEAGSIKMFAGKNATINGRVSSEGFTTVGRGGPITIDACCDLVVGDTGVVSSKGRDPGADLVHLQGCDVTIFGLVQSTGPGHAVSPNPAIQPPNLCNAPNRPGKPNQSTACVEIWSGTTLLIDATNSHHGEVNADVGQSGGTQGTGWIDLLAHKAVTINGDPKAPTAGTNNDTFPAYAVHANMPLGNGHGGTITVISTDTTVTTSGRAIQANSSTASNGGKGGHITVLAHDTIAFGTAFIQAAGDTTGGGGQAGGTIFAHSFNAKVTGSAPGQLNATGPGGIVTLEGCGEVLGDYTGTVIATTRVTDPTCTGGSPSLPVPADTQMPAATCSTVCAPPQFQKSGVKFNDVNNNGVKDAGEPGLPGWEIRIYDTNTKALVDVATTAPDGSYGFNNLTLGVSYTVCEVLQAGWVETTPNAAHAVPAGETLATDCATFDPSLADNGYRFTLDGTNPSFENDDFGNFSTPCPKFPTLVVDKTFVIDPNDPNQLQDIIDNAAVDEKILIMPHLGKKTENIVINKRIQLFGCSIDLRAADSSLPIVTITPGANGGLTKDMHANADVKNVSGGSTVAGYQIDASKHTVLNVRATNNAIGFLITGNSNLVSGAQGVNNNGIAFKVTGNSNTLDSANDVSNSLGDGVQIAGGTGNKVQKLTVKSSGGNGFFVSSAASSTTLQENKAFSNGLNGFLVQGATTMSKNVAGDIGSGNNGDGIRVDSNGGALTQNTSRSNGLVGFRVTGTGHNLSTNVSGGTASQNNLSCQYVVGPLNTNGGSNKTSGGAPFTFTSAGANSPTGCVPAPPTP